MFLYTRDRPKKGKRTLTVYKSIFEEHLGSVLLKRDLFQIFSGSENEDKSSQINPFYKSGLSYIMFS
jgi:hypothetical protein